MKLYVFLIDFFITLTPCRLIQTILPASYAASVSIFDFGMRPGPSNYPRPDCTQQPWTNCPNATNPGRTYRFYTGTPVLPFGYGLSYTTFKYELINAPNKISADAVRRVLDETASAGRTFTSATTLASYDPLVSYQVNVTNTGTLDADDVILGFLVPPNGAFFSLF
jgi:xylan 1,4-beta-xylosidase